MFVSVVAKPGFETKSDRVPISIGQSPDESNLMLGERHREEPEKRRHMKPRLPPVAQFTIGRSQRPGHLCCDQPNHDIRPMPMVVFSRKHHCRARFGHPRTRKGSDDDIAGLQWLPSS